MILLPLIRISRRQVHAADADSLTRDGFGGVHVGDPLEGGWRPARCASPEEVLGCGPMTVFTSHMTQRLHKVLPLKYCQ